MLEHLYDPWQVLNGMASLLSESGSVIVSLPHAAHSVVLASLYGGGLEFRESGILDKTHIRWFGFKNIEAMHARAGLGIVRCHLVFRSPEETELAETWRSLPAEMREALGRRNYGNVYQIVTEAVPLHRATNRITIESCFPTIPANKQRGIFSYWIRK